MEINNVDLDVLFGQKLTLVSCNVSCEALDRLILTFEEHSLSLSCDQETDEMLLSISGSNTSQKKKKLTCLDKYLGSKLDFIWKCVDPHDHFDALMFGFDNLYPDIVIIAAVDCLQILEMNSVDIQDTP